MYNNSGAGGGPGSGWVPGMGMPPLGFGVVAQQPGGSRMMGNGGRQVAPQAHQMANWQQQQFMAAQMGMASSAVGVQPMVQHHQQQHGFHPYQQSAQIYQQQQYQQQQQWVEAQKKAAEEQKKLYDQMMKQRQFDEQKMRLKAFGNTKKGGVSAESMIENILGTKDAQKPKSPPAPKKVGVCETAPSSLSCSARQGTAVDWSKMDSVNTLFATSKGNGALHVNTPSSGITATSGSMPSHPVMDSSAMGGQTPLIAPGQVLPGMPNTLETGVMNPGNVPAGNPGGVVPNKKPMGKPIPLPGWLSDKANVPAIYKHAGSLVEGKDGWVDTGRAYMLLMKTGLPPPFLGVLWEMVNRTQPGQLTDQEFATLLALVALVQAGQAITSADVLSNTSEAVLPIIDHPALLPLVQDYIQHKQKLQQQAQEQLQQTQQQQQIETGNNVWKTGSPTDSQQPAVKSGDDDDFDDFVSCPTTASGSLRDATIPQPPFGAFNSNSNINVSVPTATQQLPLSEPSKAVQKPPVLGVDKVKRMNLPELGCSPEISPSTSFDNAQDDDFDDFQSATITCAPASSTFMQSAQANQNQSQLPGGTSLNSAVYLANNINNSSNTEDKYAVFRELETPRDNSSAGNTNSLPYDIGNSVDDSFGDFCSSEPVSLPNPSSSFPPIISSNTTGSGTNSTTPVSFEVFSTPPEVPETLVDAQFEADFGVFTSASAQPPSNYADIHEAMKRVEAEQKLNTANSWSDPFGEFEDASSTQPACQPIPQLKVASGLDDDDFGDFMGPDGGLQEPDFLSFNQTFPRLSEGLGETQSVASLELPGLEMTVGLQASDGRGSGSGQSPVMFMQARNEVGGLEDQLRGLALDSPLTLPDGVGLSTPNTNGSGVPQTTGSNPVLDSFSGGLMDKYSIIRDEATKNIYDEAHTGSWQRCLEGSVNLLEQGRNTLVALTSKKLKTEVLSTSQMQDYLANLQEVWFVCERILTSSRHVTTSAKVDQLLSEAKKLWQEVQAESGDVFLKQAELAEGENQMNESEVCGVCLSGGGSKLTYGGHSYHPPCANLWLNCVDLLLPSLTPVTLL